MRLLFLLLLVGFQVFLPIQAAYAEPEEVVPNSFKQGIKDLTSFAGTQGIRTGESAADIVVLIIQFLLIMSALLAMAALVWGGIMYIMSLGDEGRAGTAKKIILYAVIGVIVVLLSFVIVTWLQALFTSSARI